MEVVLPDIESLDDLIEAMGWHDQFRAHLAYSVAVLADRQEWAIDGAASFAAWLEQHTKTDHREAGRLLREGRFLRDHQVVAEAAVTGRLSGGQTRAIHGNVTATTSELFAEHEQGVVDAIADLDLEQSRQAMQDWRNKAEACVEGPEPKVPDRSFSMGRLEDGTAVGRFVLDPTAANELDHALETARTHAADDGRTAQQRNADALASILAFFNANHGGQGTPRHRPHIELHLQAGSIDELEEFLAQDRLHATTIEGDPMGHWATDAYLCDCTIHRVLRSGNRILAYGRSEPSVPHHLRRTVLTRDGGCRAAGCKRPASWCDVHHVVWWRKGGDTNEGNLIALCSYHHHLIHKQHWQVTLNADLTVTFVAPSGKVFTTRPHVDLTRQGVSVPKPPRRRRSTASGRPKAPPGDPASPPGDVPQTASAPAVA